jgi:hypothetical membrane protein
MSVHRIAVAGIGGFALAVLVTGVITPGYAVRREAISALAALDSPHAWVMILGFTAGAVGLVCAGLALWRRVPARSARVGAGMVVAAGALIAVAGFAREDCSDQLSTCKDFGEAVHASGSYWLHSYVSLLAFLLLITSSFLVARGLRRTGQRSLGDAGRLVGVACLVGLVLLVVTPAFVADNYGLVQRLFVGVLFGWPVTTAVLAPASTGTGAADWGRGLERHDSGTAVHSRRP